MGGAPCPPPLPRAAVSDRTYVRLHASSFHRVTSMISFDKNVPPSFFFLINLEAMVSGSQPSILRVSVLTKRGK